MQPKSLRKTIEPSQLWADVPLCPVVLVQSVLHSQHPACLLTGRVEAMKRTHDDMGLAYEAALLTQQLQAPKGGRQQVNSASASKIKVCSQCGTTRTPQWREGPLGPKTLCNACGVKRVRALKAIQEGRKPPASPQLKKAAAAAAAQAAAMQQQGLHLDPPPRQVISPCTLPLHCSAVARFAKRQAAFVCHTSSSMATTTIVPSPEG